MSIFDMAPHAEEKRARRLPRRCKCAGGRSPAWTQVNVLTLGAAVICLLAGASASAGQTTMYVTDKLEVTLRSGQSTDHRIVKMLPSGTALTVIETNDESGYSHVKTGAGEEGWLLTRYLLNEPVARDRLAKAEDLIKQLQEDKQRSQTTLSALNANQSSLQEEYQKASERAKKLDQELTRIKQTAANALLIDNENQTNKQKLLSLEREYNSLQLQLQTSQDRSSRDWFMRGAGVLAGGLLLGILIPRIRIKRRSSWGSL